MNRRRFLSLLALLPGMLATRGAARSIVQNAGQPTALKFTELYGKVTVRGVEFSDKLKGLNGKRISMTGYMAPPLKPKLDFFVLTREPMSTCPFCTTAADWPADIVLVIMPDGKELDPTTRGLSVTGRLEVGAKKDDETGFVSLVRLYADRVANR